MQILAPFAAPTVDSDETVFCSYRRNPPRPLAFSL